MDCMTGWSPEAASPAHVSPSSRRADDDPGDASSIISTTIIRRKTNLVIMAIYELCAPAATSDSLMIGDLEKQNLHYCA
jgi:hypothetical protein